MRLPRLLDGSMNELARLNPSRLSATLNLEPISSATMVLPAGDPTVSVRQYVEIYKGDESLGVYRVSAARTACGDSQEISLEHAITVLEDCITPEDTELTGSFREILGTLLGYQTVKRWQLGTVDVPDSESLTMGTSGDLCLQAVINLMEMVKGYGLFFDQSTSPWTLHVRKLETSSSCECRMNRNISSVSIALDESQLVTRVESSKLPGGYQDGPTVDAWGVIARPLSVDSEATEAETVKKATEYLESYKDPAITVEIDAVELANLTGQSWDAFALGDLCRTALADFGVVVNERVSTLYYEDLLHAPQRVRLTLATPARTTQRSLAGLRRAQETTTKTVYRNSVKIIKNEKDLLVQAEELTVQAEKLTAQAAEILLKASQTEVDDLGVRVSSAEILLDGANAEIALKVSKDDIISAINLSPESITISSSRINLVGYVTATALEAELAEVKKFFTGSATAQLLKAGIVDVTSALSLGGTYASWHEMEVVTGVSGRGVTGEFKTIQYLNWDGAKASTSVMTGVTQAAFSLSNKTVKYLGVSA